MAKALMKAKKAKNDEFYTQLESIESELKHYKCHFEGKVVLCNCDDPRESNFFDYFSRNFESLKLKRLIATCYKNQNWELFSKNNTDKAVYLVYDGDKDNNREVNPKNVDVKALNGNGDFSSAECIEFLKQADIVCTNPPFSLFREYVDLLMEHKKKFLIIGSASAITYKEIFKYIKANQLWIGFKSMGTDMLFDVPDHFAEWLVKNKKEGSGYKIIDGVIKARSPALWFTNLSHKKRNQEIEPCKKYTPEEYPTYDNCDAIEVKPVTDIPIDYNGAMGVPISFLGYYNPKQFEILGMDDHGIQYPKWRGRGPDLKGKTIFRRIIIKRVQENN